LRGKVRVETAPDKGHILGPEGWRRATREGDAPPMGMSFHQAVRRFEGRESATCGLLRVLILCG
jgi:hypothetical protein